MRKTITLAAVVLAAAAYLLAACAPQPATQPPPPTQPPAGPEAAPQGVEKTVYVGPSLVDCEGVAPMKCLQVKESPDGEYSLFYGAIEGFQFEEGNEYELVVRENPIPNPPADAPSFTWTLVRVVSQTPAGPLPVDVLPADQYALEWYLNEAGEQVPVLPEAPITLQYADGSVAGNSGCNQYNASVEVNANLVTFGPAASTLMACDQPIMDQEAAYLALLEKAASFELSEGKLVFLDQDGNAILSFAVQPAGEPMPVDVLPADLYALDWYLNEAGEQTPVLPGTQITLQYADGRIAGNAGCNQYNASVEVNANLVTIGPAISTMMACDQPIMDQEAAYLALLEKAASFELSEGGLVFKDQDGAAILSFSVLPPVALEGTNWQVLSYNNGQEALVSVLAGTSINALFSEDGTLSGSAGCNNYTSSYTVDGDQISIGPAASTRMMCSDPEGVMEQEAQYLLALESARTFEISADRLTLFAESGARAAEFQAMQLTGAPWYLAEIQYSDETVKTPDAPENYSVTFLPDGSLLFVADCNQGNGTYTTDGPSLSIELGVMTLVACPPDSLSDEYLRNLGQAASYLFQDGDLYIAMQVDTGIMKFTRVP